MEEISNVPRTAYRPRVQMEDRAKNQTVQESQVKSQRRAEMDETRYRSGTGGLPVRGETILEPG